MQFNLKSIFQQVKSAFSAPEGESFIDYQRRYMFYYSIGLIFTCIPLYVLVVSPDLKIYNEMNATLFLLELAFLGAFSFRKISIKTALTCMLLLIQFENSLEIIIASLDMMEYPRLQIMANMMLSLMFLMISICAYMKRLTNWLAIIPAIGYIIGSLLIDGPHLLKYLLITVALLLLAVALGHIVYNTTKKMQEENTLLKSEEKKVLKSLRLSREELFAFVELVSTKTSNEETKILIDTIGPQAKENLFSVLHTHLQTERTQLEIIQKVFPELSSSEQTICQLILQGKTIGEICEILFKSSGNITSQRAHIRAKLGLKKEENLKEVLEKKLQEYHAME